MLSLVLAPLVASRVSAESIQANASIAGYVDFSYAGGTTPVKSAPIEYVPESSVWWNDGSWWGILFDPGASLFKIYKLNGATQTWAATSTAVDSRHETNAITEVGTSFDVLWDGTKLYIASKIKRDNPGTVNDPVNYGLLSRYSYSGGSYTIDDGYPVAISQEKTRSLVIDKDSEGRLWAAYVSRVNMPDPTPNQYHTFVTYSDGNDSNWNYTTQRLNLGTMPDAGGEVTVNDVASVVAFGDRVGVMWSNANTGNYYFAWKTAASAPETGWNIQVIDPSDYAPIASHDAHDHIRLAADGAGNVFATVKTRNPSSSDDAFLGVFARDYDSGNFSFHSFNSDFNSQDTRPTLVLDESNNRLFMFVVSNEAGGYICYKTMTIQDPFSSMAFDQVGNCAITGAGAPLIIADETHFRANNPTTSKHSINSDTGLLVLASDDDTGSYYLHNYQAITPPVPPVEKIYIYMPMIYR